MSRRLATKAKSAGLLLAGLDSVWRQASWSLPGVSLLPRPDSAVGESQFTALTSEEAISIAKEIRKQQQSLVYSLDEDVLHEIGKFLTFEDAVQSIREETIARIGHIPRTPMEWETLASSCPDSIGEQVPVDLVRLRRAPEKRGCVVICMSPDAGIREIMQSRAFVLKQVPSTTAEVVLATGPTDAMQSIRSALRRERLPIVVMSLQLPSSDIASPSRKNGFLFITQVRELKRGIPIVVFTAGITLSWKDELRLACEGIDADRIVLKETDADTKLSAAIFGCLQRQLSLSSIGGAEWRLNGIDLALKRCECTLMQALMNLAERFGSSAWFTTQQIAEEMIDVGELAWSLEEPGNERAETTGLLSRIMRWLGDQDRMLAENICWHWAEMVRECGNNSQKVLEVFIDPDASDQKWVLKGRFYFGHVRRIGLCFLTESRNACVAGGDAWLLGFIAAMSSLGDLSEESADITVSVHHKVQDSIYRARHAISRKMALASTCMTGHDVILSEDLRQAPEGMRCYKLRSGLVPDQDPGKTHLLAQRAEISVLIVEDEEAYLHQIQDAVQELGLRNVYSARYRDEAIRLCHLIRPSLVSLDMHLPASADPGAIKSESCGLDVLSEIRASDSNTRVAICTTLFDEASLRSKAKALGVPALHVVPKSGNWPEDLKVVLEAFIREGSEGRDLSATLAETRAFMHDLTVEQYSRELWPLTLQVVDHYKCTWILKINGALETRVELVSPSRSRLFGVLLAHAGTHINRSDLIERLFGGRKNALSSALMDLRHKIISMCSTVPPDQREEAANHIVQTDKGRGSVMFIGEVLDTSNALSAYRELFQ